MNFIAVAAGGALGALLRYMISLKWGGAHLLASPVLMANILGCFLFGFLASTLKEPAHEHWRLLLQVGFFGALTTFSSYAFEALQVSSKHGWWSGALVVLTHLVLGFLALAIGLYLAKMTF